ncbi:hypothetical protein FFWV33_03870 [Flavobacterium faecale]|uniref:DUF4468 domain-containing protein n=1 Tax=Flavobacterium faecale TaxID=1355330 RepID=A0A2S1LIK1_9FLAO|nr:hypothetical protein [Flavobacterium faecale]AWG23547.1 hypothetical protein FFWV33_03870 [Flavobacterium faecale]
MKRSKIFLIFTYLLISQLSFSQIQDDVLLSKILNQLKIKKSEVNLELISEKKLPYSTDKTVIVIPKYIVNEKDEYNNYYFELDEYIIVANNITGEILYKFHQPNAWTSDAVMLTSIEIDTGLYKLNKKDRAFGIRVNYTGSSRPNPYYQTDLSLFIVQDNILKQVLKNLIISEFHGEWDTNCAGEFEDSKSIISIDKTQFNNFNNLILATIKTETKNIPTNEDCVEQKKTQKTQKILKYNGTEYK